MKEQYRYLGTSARTDEEAIIRLKEIISILRKECPWDIEQTHDTLKSCMLEEAYEAVDAIDRCDVNNLEEELGDVMLQVVFHSNLAEEEDLFDLKSVINRECRKNDKAPSAIFLEERANNDIKSIDNGLGKMGKYQRQGER